MSTTESVPEAVLQIVAAVRMRLPDDIGGPLRDQLRLATVLSEEPGRSIDLSVPADAPQIPATDGPLPVCPSVVDEQGVLTGEVLVWVRGGWLTGLERPWFTAEAPTEWPRIHSLDFTKQT